MSDSVVVYILCKKFNGGILPVTSGINSGIFATLADAELAKTLEQAACTDSRTEFDILEMTIPKVKE